jgi:hypothetical protein
MYYTVLRNNRQFIVNLCNLRSDDLVLAQNGHFYPANSFSELENYFPRPIPSLSESLMAIGGTILVTAGLVGAVMAIGALLQPRYNSVPLSKRVKNYIRERDNEICFYCNRYAPNGHVDHMISRYNGGSNDLENLTWACITCNCSKGALNDVEYLALLRECY